MWEMRPCDRFYLIWFHNIDNSFQIRGAVKQTVKHGVDSNQRSWRYCTPGIRDINNLKPQPPTPSLNHHRSLSKLNNVHVKLTTLDRTIPPWVGAECSYPQLWAERTICFTLSVFSCSGHEVAKRSNQALVMGTNAPGERPGACSGLRSGAWPWKRNNGRLGAFN